MSIECPIECVGVGCPQPDFIERNGTWLITIVGVWVGCFGSLLTYFLKSRCSKLKCCGLEVHRTPIQLDEKTATVDKKEDETSPDDAQTQI